MTWLWYGIRPELDSTLYLQLDIAAMKRYEESAFKSENELVAV